MGGKTTKRFNFKSKKMTEVKECWKIVPAKTFFDEGRFKVFRVTNGEKGVTFIKEADAKWLCDLLNSVVTNENRGLNKKP